MPTHRIHADARAHATPAEAGLRRRLIELQYDIRALRLSRALRKYSPDQPRVPAGNPTGGRWTSGGGGGGGGFGLGGLLGVLISAPSLTFDESGLESWDFFEETSFENGELAGFDVVNRDGSTIHSEYGGERRGADWDERHTVTLDDGAKTSFVTADRTQSILDGGFDGRLISRATWTSDGPEPDATIEPANGIVLQGAGAAGTALFGWLGSRAIVDGQPAIMGFIARGFGERGVGSIELDYVGQFSRSQAEAACFYLPEMQYQLDRAVAAAGGRELYPSDAVYGTAVHTRVKNQINEMRIPNLRAEQSFESVQTERLRDSPGGQVPYGTQSSVRVDAYELRDDGTLCVYDFKTGKAGVSTSRADILAHMARLGLSGEKPINRVLVIEVRPSR